MKSPSLTLKSLWNGPMPTGRSEWNGPKLVGKFPGLASKLKKKEKKKKRSAGLPGKLQ